LRSWEKEGTYEGVIEKNGKKAEVAVEGDGKPLRP
jgi:hypothetical protein